MDLWMSGKKLTPFNNFIYFCVCDIDRIEPYQEQYSCLNVAGIYQESQRQLIGYYTQQLIVQIYNCGR